MSYQLTKQQQDIVDEIINPTADTLLVEAVAGASKSYTLSKASDAFFEHNTNRSFRYLVFGTLQAEEARQSMNSNCIVSTLHSLAFHHTIKCSTMYLSQTSFISWKDIPKYIHQPFGQTPSAIELIETFCASTEMDVNDLEIINKYTPGAVKLANDIMTAMVEGKMGCTHPFYLKVFHMEVMSGETKLATTDILAVDECQDLTPITLDIIRAYPAKLKVLVGDTYQSIFSFMGCINAFDYFKDAKELSLTKSFRCESELAKRVEAFSRATFNHDMVFTGFEYPVVPTEYASSAYLTRTNAELIGKMIELNESGTPYKLATTAKINQMFELPLALLRCKPGNKEKNPKYKQMQRQADLWGKSTHLQQLYPSRMAYLASENPDNPDVKPALRMISAHSPAGVIDAHNSAKSHQKCTTASLSLLTVHTSKGTTFDSVELADDVNQSIDSIMSHILECRGNGTTPLLASDELTELYLYYVAVTRARYNVDNAAYLL